MSITRKPKQQLPGHFPADVGNLLLGQSLLQVHDDGVQGPAVAVLKQHLHTHIDINKARKNVDPKE